MSKEKQITEMAKVIDKSPWKTVLGLNFEVYKIGKTVFLTREEAEKALEERNDK